MSLHPGKFRYPVKSALFTACAAEGPALNAVTLTPGKVQFVRINLIVVGVNLTESVSTPVFAPEECYGTFALEATTNLNLSHPTFQTQVSTQSAPFFNESETPYGYFGMDDIPTSIAFQTPRNSSGNVGLNTPPSLAKNTSSPTVFTFQISHQNENQNIASEDNYGYFNPELISPSHDANHDMVLSTASSDSSHVDAPTCHRSLSDGTTKNRSTIDSNGFPSAIRLHHSQSHKVTSNSGASPINRLQLSSLLDESSHQAWKEGKYQEAYQITHLVHNEIRSYLQNLKQLHGQQKKDENDSHTPSKLTDWIPTAAATEDLRLLAKTLAQKGDIQKVSNISFLDHSIRECMQTLIPTVLRIKRHGTSSSFLILLPES